MLKTDATAPWGSAVQRRPLSSQFCLSRSLHFWPLPAAEARAVPTGDSWAPRAAVFQSGRARAGAVLGDRLSSGCFPVCSGPPIALRLGPRWRSAPATFWSQIFLSRFFCRSVGHSPRLSIASGLEQGQKNKLFAGVVSIQLVNKLVRTSSLGDIYRGRHRKSDQ